MVGVEGEHSKPLVPVEKGAEPEFIPSVKCGVGGGL